MMDDGGGGGRGGRESRGIDQGKHTNTEKIIHSKLTAGVGGLAGTERGLFHDKSYSQQFKTTMSAGIETEFRDAHKNWGFTAAMYSVRYCV